MPQKVDGIEPSGQKREEKHMEGILVAYSGIGTIFDTGAFTRYEFAGARFVPDTLNLHKNQITKRTTYGKISRRIF